MGKPWYTTREVVKSALDVKSTARNDTQIDAAIEAASRSVEGLLRRRFYPEFGTRHFDWPDQGSPTTYRLWFDANEMISATTVTAAGTTVSGSSYWLRRSDGRAEAPYSHLELDIGTTSTFDQGDTHQRNIAITGWYGYGNDTAVATVLDEALDASETGVDVTNSAGVGVGDLIKIDDEYMQVTEKVMKDTAVDIDAGDSLTASNSDVTITASTTTGIPAVGETILIDSERMLVVDVAGTAVTVKRAWDGTVLAAHAALASIYAPRTLTVTRAAVGSTAATHTATTTVYRHVPPGTVQELCIAYALNNLLQRQSGYARVAGEGEGAREFTGRGIKAIELDARRGYGRIRLGGV